MISQFNYDAFDEIEKFKNNVTISINDKYSANVVDNCRIVRNRLLSNNHLYILDVVRDYAINNFDNIKFKRYMKKTYPSLYSDE